MKIVRDFQGWDKRDLHEWTTKKGRSEYHYPHRYGASVIGKNHKSKFACHFEQCFINSCSFFDHVVFP